MRRKGAPAPVRSWEDEGVYLERASALTMTVMDDDKPPEWTGLFDAKGQ